MTQHRETRQRQIVLETVLAHTDHPSADEIYLESRTIDPKISRGTVYRNLNCLSENDEINHVKVPGSADRFDHRLDLHYHLFCVKCGSVIDAPIPYEALPDQEVAEQTGYTIMRHRTVFEGICPACRMKKETAKLSASSSLNL